MSPRRWSFSKLMTATGNDEADVRRVIERVRQLGIVTTINSACSGDAGVIHVGPFGAANLVQPKRMRASGGFSLRRPRWRVFSSPHIGMKFGRALFDTPFEHVAVRYVATGVRS